MIIPNLLDTFNRSDTDSIAGNSDSGHLWIPSGKCLPCLRNGRLTGSHPAAYDNAVTYSQWSNVLYGGVVYVYKNATPSAGNVPPNATYWEGVSGNYAFVDVIRKPEYQYVDAYWEISGQPIVLASSNLDNALTHTTHVYFSDTGVNVQVRNNGGSFDSLAAISFSATLGITHRIGVKYCGDRVVVVYPGGELSVVNQRFSQVVGRYLMYQMGSNNYIESAGCVVGTRALI